MKTKTGYSYRLLTSVRSVIVIPTIVTSNLPVLEVGKGADRGTMVGKGADRGTMVGKGADRGTIPSCLINGK